MTRHTAEADSEWFEISADLWLDSKAKPKKLKLLADAQFPKDVADKIGIAGISIERLDKSRTKSPDEDLVTYAKKRGMVLLTLDGDFWSDRKHPLQQVNGIIYIDVPSENHKAILDAFGLVYGGFAKSYPLDWWHGMKIRAIQGEFTLKMRNWAGQSVAYKIRQKGGHVVAKELSKVPG